MSSEQRPPNYINDFEEKHILFGDIVLQSYNDISSGKGHQCSEFFNKLAERYLRHCDGRGNDKGRVNMYNYR